MMSRFLLPVFAATLFTSALLIFSVQPMVSKMLLPMLGGSPSVWNTAMVFFQAALLAGYGYAHLLAKLLSLRGQAIIHLLLLLFFTSVLPLTIPKDTIPPEQSGQAFWQLSAMLLCVGGPFFVLAASAPLFQHWFASSNHKDAGNPYFLYAISNAGSMAALLGYPLLAEPFLTVFQQTSGWLFGYILLIALTVACGWLVRNGIKPAPQPVSPHDDAGTIGIRKRLAWIVLALIPSSLMLGVTTLITTDLASAPFLWIVPLTIYLTTFIIAFARKPLMGTTLTRELTVYVLCLTVLMLMINDFVALKIPMVFVHLLTFFLGAMLCHGELAKTRPAPSHLTEYFMLISFGGMLGGVFNALLAPVIFKTPLEYPLTLAALAFIIWAGSAQSTLAHTPGDHGRAARKKNLLLSAGYTIIGLTLCLVTYWTSIKLLQVIGIVSVFLFLMIAANKKAAFAITTFTALVLFHTSLWSTEKALVAFDRNYFGVIRIYEQQDLSFFYHGTTLHGAQSKEEKWKKIPVTYYSPDSPASDTFKLVDKHGGKQRIAGLGLGVGSIACYTAPNRSYDFYEIDPDVAKIAEDPAYFTYLSDCGSDYKILLGDARLKIGEAEDASYDMIFVDTFSSDNIPVHIMTKEAFQTYLDKLSPQGIIVINISNRYLDLRSPLDAITTEFGLTMYYKQHDPEQKKDDISEAYAKSSYVAIARDPETLAPLINDHEWKSFSPKKTTRIWTDDYANILSSLIFLQ